MFFKYILLFLLPFQAYSAYQYIRSIKSGKTIPKIVTWFFWGLAPLVTFGAAVSGGVEPFSIFSVFAAGFFPFLIFLYSIFFFKFRFDLTLLDKICAFLAILALVTWAFTKDPTYAIILSILTDLVAGLPLLINSYKSPSNENPSIYITGIVGGILSILIVDQINFNSISFSVYIICMDIAVLLPVYFWKLRNLPSNNR